MAGAQPPVGQHLPQWLVQAQKPQRIGDVTAALADGSRQHLLRMTKFLYQPLEGLRLLERGEVAALEVLDQRELQRLAVAELAHDHRDLVQPGPLRCAPAPLAGHDLVAGRSRGRPHEEGLEHAMLAQRGCQRLQLVLGEGTAGLEGGGAEELDRDPQRAALLGLRLRLGLAQKGRQAHPKPAPPRLWRRLGHQATRSRSRRNISPARWA